MVTLRDPLPAELAEDGVDGALLSVRKHPVELAQKLVAVLVPSGHQVEQAQLQKVLFQHKAPPVPRRPTRIMTVYRIT